MRVGCSIQSPAFKEVHNVFLAQHDSLEAFLQKLKADGVKSIEIRKLDRVIDEETYHAYNQSIQKIWDMGLTITIHGDLTGDLEGSSFKEIYPSMTYILENYAKYQDKLVMTLHALSAKNQPNHASVEELKQNTIDRLSNWSKVIEAEKLPVYLALENNRSKEKAIDPGNSCKVVLEMVEAVDSPHVGICWDMGHLYSNLIEGKELKMALHELPPKSFLEKVYHTHIHALNKEGKTHFPLSEEFDLPIDDYVSALNTCNYEGVFNLELSFDRYEKEMPVKEKITDSVEKLKSLSKNMVTEE